MCESTKYYNCKTFFSTFTALITIEMTKFLYKIILFLFPLLLVCACQEKEKPIETEIETEDINVDTVTVLEHLLERGKLVAATDFGVFNYRMSDGKPTGFEYELLNDFCTSNNLKLELLVIDDLDSCLSMLDSCQIDVLATGIGTNREMKQKYLLTTPILTQRSVLVQRMPKRWHDMSTGNEIENQLLRSPMDLAGKTIVLPKGSHNIKVLQHLSDEIGDTIFIVESDTLNSLDLVRQVSEGIIDYTVVEEYVAQMADANFSGLDTKLAVSIEQPLGWALKNHGNDSSLLIAVNTWIDNYEQRNMRRVLARYVKKGNDFKSSKAESEGHICEYDKAIRKVAKNIGWDWRLLASIIYQESRFKPDLESDKGAFGLMQLMPVIMEQYEIDYDATPEEQLAAGGKLIKYLDKCLADKVMDSTERVKFVLAAYNSGLGHIYDARRLAEKYGKDPNVWTDNVDYFILNKSKSQYYNDTCCRNGYLRGTETYRFVDEVMERYEHYRALVN